MLCIYRYAVRLDERRRSSSMNWRSHAWWPLRQRKGRLSQGPEAALFQGLRIRLTLWYSLVLCAALVIFSVILYLGARYFLLNPVEDNTAMHAHAHVQQWLTNTPYRGACPLLGSIGSPGQFGPPLLHVCMSMHGSVVFDGI